MNSWILHHICFLNAGFTTAIKRKRMEKSCLTERTPIAGWTKQTSVDCTRMPKSSLEPAFFGHGKTLAGTTLGTAAEQLIIYHTLEMIAKILTLAHWHHGYLVDYINILHKNVSRFWGEGEEKEGKDRYFQPVVLDILKNKEKRGIVQKKIPPVHQNQMQYMYGLIYTVQILYKHFIAEV